MTRVGTHLGTLCLVLSNSNWCSSAVIPAAVRVDAAVTLMMRLPMLPCRGWGSYLLLYRAWSTARLTTTHARINVLIYISRVSGSDRLTTLVVWCHGCWHSVIVIVRYQIIVYRAHLPQICLSSSYRCMMWGYRWCHILWLTRYWDSCRGCNVNIVRWGWYLTTCTTTRHYLGLRYILSLLGFHRWWWDVVVLWWLRLMMQ